MGSRHATGREVETVIRVGKAAIEQALRLVSVGLGQYCWLQSELHERNVAHDDEFQTRFNGFYRVRRNADWRSQFYALLEREKSAKRPFPVVLRALSKATGRVEASFASKLVATA